MSLEMLNGLQEIPLAHGVLGYGDDLITAAIGIILVIGLIRAVRADRRTRMSASKRTNNSDDSVRDSALPLAANDLDNDIRRLD